MYSIDNHIAVIDACDYIARYRNVGKFIGFCRECSKYGKSWACPPYDYDTDSYISDYNNVYIIGTRIVISENTKKHYREPDACRNVADKILDETRRKLDMSLLNLELAIPESRAFFAGSCKFCREEDCTRIKGSECCSPQMIRPSLEALGFDVVGTAKDILGIEMCWSRDGLLPDYYTLTSGFFTRSPIDEPREILKKIELA